MVMWSPLGTPGTYWDTGSSSVSWLSCASCMMIAAVMVFVFEAIRKYVSARGRFVVLSWVVPLAAVNSPCGVRKSTTAPGMRRSLTVLSTRDCRAAWSIGLSADAPAVEAGGGGAPVPGDAAGADTVCVDGTGTVAHAA